jgi:putative flippase GtrA
VTRETTESYEQAMPFVLNRTFTFQLKAKPDRMLRQFKRLRRCFADLGHLRGMPWTKTPRRLRNLSK